MTPTMWVAIFTACGAVAGAVAAVYTTRRTTKATETAAKHDDLVEAERLGIEGLRELAQQNRLDREEMRRDRTELRQRLDHVEGEVADLKRLVGDLRVERNSLVRYIRRLREFIAGLGHTPPEPDSPLNLDV